MNYRVNGAKNFSKGNLVTRLVALVIASMAVLTVFFGVPAWAAEPTGRDIGVAIITESGWAYAGRVEDHPLVKQLVATGVSLNRIVLISPGLAGQARDLQVKELVSGLSVPGVKRWVPIALGNAAEPLRAMVSANMTAGLAEAGKAGSRLAQWQSQLATAQQRYTELTKINPNILVASQWKAVRAKIEAMVQGAVKTTQALAMDRLDRLGRQVGSEKARVSATLQSQLNGIDATRKNLLAEAETAKAQAMADLFRRLAVLEQQLDQVHGTVSHGVDTLHATVAQAQVLGEIETALQAIGENEFQAKQSQVVILINKVQGA
jgi:hypothetical protein